MFFEAYNMIIKVNRLTASTSFYNYLLIRLQLFYETTPLEIPDLTVRVIIMSIRIYD